MSRRQAPAPPDRLIAGPTTVGPAISSVGQAISLSAFYALLGVLCARPLISESFQNVEFSFLSALGVPAGPSPATTAWLDSLLLLAAALAFLVTRGTRRRDAAASLATVASVLLALAVVVSTWAADDKRAAANAGSNLLVLAIAGTALVRLMRARWMLHVLLAAVLAGGGVNAAKCITQKAYEFEDVLQEWERQKPQLAAAGADLADPLLINYERRVRSAEAFGYLFHPNVTASCMAMCLVVAAAVVAGLALGGRRRWLAALMLPVVGGAAVAIAFTGSLGAMVAAMVGGGALVLFATASVSSIGAGPVMARFDRPIAAAARRLFSLIVAVYVLLVAAGAAYGLTRGTLPHVSLAFRWQYWTAAADAYRQTPLTGLGRENFAAAYLRHKLPQATEEVRDPHNLWVSLLVELGPLGLLAGMLLAGVALRRALPARDAASPRQASAGPLAVLARLAPAAIAVLVVQAWFSATPFETPGVAVIWSVELALLWIVLFALGVYAIARLDERPAGAAWLSAGVAAALFAALVHDLIDFSLLTPAGLSMFVALSAVAWALASPGGKSADDPAAERRTSAANRSGALPARTLGPLGPAALLVVVWLTHGGLIATPTARAEFWREQMRTAFTQAASASDVAAAEHFGSLAAAADRWDATALQLLAQYLRQFAVDARTPAQYRLAWLERARGYAEKALGRNPRDVGTRRTLARIAEGIEEMHRTAGRDAQALAALRAAGEAWRRVIELYPSGVRDLMQTGLVYLQVWRNTHDAADADCAGTHLHRALQIDALRPPADATRLRERERRAVTDALEELDRGAATTGPARPREP